MPPVQASLLRLCSLGMLSLLAACAAPVATSKPVVAPPPPPPGTEVEKMREQLQVSPWDLVFCAARGAAGVDESVSARNLTADPVEVRAIFVTGEEAALFHVGNLPS